MVRVLFVCLGNICRSPMAHAVFAHKVEAAGLKDCIYIDSAGTGHWHLGEPPHSAMMSILDSKGIQYSHRARLLEASDLNDFDYVLGMDKMNMTDIRSLGSGSAKTTLFLSFAPELEVTEVPDPYYNGRFDEVFQLVEAAASRLLQEIKLQHNL